ncbi:MAG: OmpH family outer membrane protein [Nevskiales bacterium]|nr:OmpH family outer membrane protein [Nevskiales bacterium]
MRHVPVCLMVVAALAAALAATPASAETKMAAIRSRSLLFESPQYKAASEKMKSEFEARGKALDAERQSLEDDFKKAQREADAMSPQQRGNTEKEIGTRKLDLDTKQRRLAEQMQAREQELTRELQAAITQAIAEVAKERGLDLVLQDPVYAVPAMDITDEVLKRLSQPGARGEKKK